MVNSLKKNSILKKGFEYYLTNHSELVKTYYGKFIVIKDQKVVGAYDSGIEAYSESIKTLELGTFLIQEYLPREENYTQTFITPFFSSQKRA